MRLVTMLAVVLTTPIVNALPKLPNDIIPTTRGFPADELPSPHNDYRLVLFSCFSPRTLPSKVFDRIQLSGRSLVRGYGSLYNCTSEAFAVGDTGDFIIGRARADLVLLIQRSLHQGMGSNALIYDRSFLRVM